MRRHRNAGGRGEPRTDGLTDEQVEKIAGEVPPGYRALIWLLAETGMRPGEALALRVEHVADQKPKWGIRDSIRVVENFVEVGGMNVLGTPKTEGSVRNVPVSTRLKRELRHTSMGSTP